MIFNKVTPFVGVWIEIFFIRQRLKPEKGHSLRGSVDWNLPTEQSVMKKNYVTPFVGVWIEISSHKSNNVFCFVTPFVGVWIEINKTVLSALSFSVTPFVGVWIEILCMIGNRLKMMSSLPSWECGLKLRKVWRKEEKLNVAPFVRMHIQLYFTWCGLY